MYISPNRLLAHDSQRSICQGVKSCPPGSCMCFFRGRRSTLTVRSRARFGCAVVSRCGAKCIFGLGGHFSWQVRGKLSHFVGFKSTLFSGGSALLGCADFVGSATLCGPHGSRHDFHLCWGNHFLPTGRPCLLS